MYLQRRQAADRIGLNPFQFNRSLQALIRNGFPAPDPETGYFLECDVERWIAEQPASVCTHHKREEVRGKLHAIGIYPGLDPFCTGFVYFIEGVGCGRMKIGRAIDPVKRKADLEVGSPMPLDLICAVPGGKLLEWYLHEKFAPEHIHREWFELSPRLQAYIRFASRVGHAPVSDLYYLGPPLPVKWGDNVR